MKREKVREYGKKELAYISIVAMIFIAVLLWPHNLIYSVDYDKTEVENGTIVNFEVKFSKVVIVEDDIWDYAGHMVMEKIPFSGYTLERVNGVISKIYVKEVKFTVEAWDTGLFGLHGSQHWVKVWVAPSIFSGDIIREADFNSGLIYVNDHFGFTNTYTVGINSYFYNDTVYVFIHAYTHSDFSGGKSYTVVSHVVLRGFVVYQDNTPSPPEVRENPELQEEYPDYSQAIDYADDIEQYFTELEELYPKWEVGLARAEVLGSFALSLSSSSVLVLAVVIVIWLRMKKK